MKVREKLALRRRRLKALRAAEKNAQNPEFKQLWARKKKELLNLDI